MYRGRGNSRRGQVDFDHSSSGEQKVRNTTFHVPGERELVFVVERRAGGGLFSNILTVAQRQVVDF